jgi:hypothetical protein
VSSEHGLYVGVGTDYGERDKTKDNQRVVTCGALALRERLLVCLLADSCD